MVKVRTGSWRHKVAVALLIAALGMSGLSTTPAAADVTAVTGSAYGFFANVGLFGGPASTRGPSPSVTLPAAGGNETDTAPSGSAVYGPAILIDTGPMSVSTEGTTGAGGSVTSAANVEFPLPQEDQVDPFNADSISSTCTASEGTLSGSTTLTNASIVLATDPDTEEPVQTEVLPSSPAANLEFPGTIDHIPDSFRVVFNEQIEENGVLTVNAVHLYLGQLPDGSDDPGSTARGDLIIGQSVCGVDSDGNTGTTTTTAPDGSTTTTTAPDGSTTTTTAPDGSTTTTTAPDGSTTTTTPPDPGGECVPAPGSFSARILELSQVFDIPALSDALGLISQTICQLEQRFGFGGNVGAQVAL